MVISLDSSGVKVTNRGEWMRQKWKVRRGCEGPTYRSKNPRKEYAREFREIGYKGWLCILSFALICSMAC